ncbi:MAG TPA: TetR/AcrR family transcriptional regulator C-terminal domain-containing protein, partial [Solirubrobacteraceae bacterium]
GPTPEAQPGEGWRASLARWARAMAAAMRAHPWSTRVPVAGPPLTPNTVAWVDGALAALGGTGLAEAEKASVAMMLSGYVRNHVSLMGEVATNFLAAATTPDEAMRGYSDTLRALVAGERYPALRAVLDAGVFDRADPPEAEFDFGLERILDGIEALTRARAAR